MGLVACPDCGHEVSARARSCPKCGLPDPDTTAHRRAHQERISSPGYIAEWEAKRRTVVGKTAATASFWWLDAKGRKVSYGRSAEQKRCCFRRAHSRTWRERRADWQGDHVDPIWVRITEADFRSQGEKMEDLPDHYTYIGETVCCGKRVYITSSYEALALTAK